MKPSLQFISKITVYLVKYLPKLPMFVLMEFDCANN